MSMYCRQDSLAQTHLMPSVFPQSYAISTNDSVNITILGNLRETEKKSSLLPCIHNKSSKASKTL